MLSFPPASASDPITGPTTILTAGNYSLQNDFTNGNGTPFLAIEASDVMFDGNGYTLRGTGSAFNIYVNNLTMILSNVTVKNVTVRDEDAGIAFESVNGGTIEDVNATVNYQGLKLINSTSVTINGCIVLNNTHGIVLTQGSDYNTLSNNDAWNNTYEGIDLSASSHNTISGNRAYNNTKSNGITIEEQSNDNTLLNNVAIGNYEDGILIYNSTKNSLTGNTATGNYRGIELIFFSNSNTLSGNNASVNQHGIRVETSSFNTFTSDTADNNTPYAGFYLVNSTFNRIFNAIVNWNGGEGIELEDNSSSNIIRNATINFNADYGFLLYVSHNNTLTENTISSCYKGFVIYDSSENTLANNTIKNSTVSGILIDSPTGKSRNNTFFNNFFNNTLNVGFSGTWSGNIWNRTKQSGTSIAGGSFLGGNYWAQPDRNGFSQTHADTDGDGIINTQYSLAVGDTDWLPLIAVSGGGSSGGGGGGSSGSDESGGGPGGGPQQGPGQGQQQQQQAGQQQSQQQAGQQQIQAAPATAPEKTETVSVNTEGLSVTTTAAGQQELVIDVAAAEKAGSAVSVRGETIVISQPGLDIIVQAEGIGFGPEGTVTGTIQSVGIATAPVTADIGIGQVSTSIDTSVSSIPTGASVTTTISEKVSSDTQSAFQAAAAQNNLKVEAVAYTMTVEKTNLDAVGPATITMTSPAAWVNQHGGHSAIQIARISDTGVAGMLATSYRGMDSAGNMVFEGLSPDGLSIFGMISAKASQIRQEQQGVNVSAIPQGTPVTPLTVIVGMATWAAGMVTGNIFFMGIGVALLCIASYVVWRRRSGYDWFFRK